MTKDPSRKQIIVPMSSGNSNKFMVLYNKYVSNINKILKDIKSDVLANFIWANNRSLMITTNKVISTSDLSIIEKYINNINVTDLNDVMSPRLSKSKSYLKILGILYFIEDINILITLDIIKKVL